MPAPASNPELLTLIAKSGVFDDARIRAYLTGLAAQPGGVPADPVKLATRMVRDGVLTTFQAENLLAGRWKRFAIGKYKVLERLGVGGMGQVFLCEHKLMKRKVAVKVLPAAKAKDQAALQRFYREARAVAAMDHPNLVRAYDIDQDQNLHFLVMEFVDGANLHDIVRKSGPLPVPRACHYVYATAVGLQHAHEMGLVHRDVKPANILVDRTGVVKILDMGLARFFDPDENDHLTKKYDENVLGTADYLAPEQAIDSSAADIRADLYALGGTFYFLLTGQPPFPDGSVAQKLLAHQSRPPKAVRDLRPDVPAEVAAVIDKLMAKEPAARYQTPNELMAALTPWVQTPIPPPPEHEMPQLSAAATAGVVRPGSSSNQLAAGEQYRQNPLVLAPAAPSAPPVARPPASRPATAQPAAVATPPQADDPANPWESITSPETLPTSSLPTGKNQPGAEPGATPAGRSHGRISPAKLPLKPVLLAAVIGGAVLLLVGGVAVALFVLNPFGGKTLHTPATKPREPQTWYVSAAGTGPDPDHTRKSLKELGKELKSGDTVVFTDDTFESDSLSIRGVNLEAGNATRSVTWIYKPEGGKAAAVLDLPGGGTVRGLVIDAGGQCDHGVLITGPASGVTLDNVTVKNAKKMGIRVHNATAADGQPIRITNCRVTAGATADGAVAVTGTTRTGTVGVEVSGCRLEGAGKGAAILIEGNVTLLEVKNCRAFQFAAGVSVLTVGDKMDVTVERNTFHTLAAGLKVDQPLSVNTPIILRQNYFGATAEVGKVAGDPLMVKAENNGRDAGSKDGNLTTPVANGVVPKPKPNAPDNQFLVTAGKVTGGDKKTPIGAD